MSVTSSFSRSHSQSAAASLFGDACGTGDVTQSLQTEICRKHFGMNIQKKMNLNDVSSWCH